MMLSINVKDLNYDKKDKCFSEEISMLQHSGVTNINALYHEVCDVTLYNPVTGKSKVFSLKKVDKDGSGEDIYGWNFATKDGLRLLIIND